MDRQLLATITGGLAGTMVLPACLISPVLVLGCASVMAVCIPAMARR